MSRTVVLAALDSLRYDIFTDYIKNSTSESSFLSYISSTGTNFQAASASAPWSLPSYASIFTGKYPSEHGAITVENPISSDIDTILDYLTENNIRTGCFSANTYVTPEFGFRGWDHHQDHYHNRRYPDADPIQISGGDKNRYSSLIQSIINSDTPLKTIVNGIYRTGYFRDSGAKRVTTDAINWLSEHPDEDCFLFLGYMETHSRNLKHLLGPSAHFRNIYKYRDQQKLRSKFSANYYMEGIEMTSDDRKYLKQIMEEELAYIDRQLRRFWNEIKKQGRADECLFVIFADHGDGFGEQGIVNHHTALTERLIRTPLLIKSPSSKRENISDRVSLSWIHSTILEYFNISERGNKTDLLNQETYPSLVGSENTNRLCALVDAPAELDEKFLKNRTAVWQTDEPEVKYVKIGDEYVVRETDLKTLNEETHKFGGEEKIQEFKNDLNTVESEEKSLSEKTKDNLSDLGYI